MSITYRYPRTRLARTKGIADFDVLETINGRALAVHRSGQPHKRGKKKADQNKGPNTGKGIGFPDK